MRAWVKVKVVPHPYASSFKNNADKGFQIRYCMYSYLKGFLSYQLSNLKRLDFYHLPYVTNTDFLLIFQI